MVSTDADDLNDDERIHSYVVFQIEAEHFALEVGCVQEVLDVAALTQVPGSAPALRGLFNLRGHVLPVWDVRVAFGENPAPAALKTHCVLMVEPPSSRASKVCGLLVDKVSDVLEFTPEELQPVPTLGLGAVSPFLRGLFRHQDKFLLALDLDRVFEALAREPSEHGP